MDVSLNKLDFLLKRRECDLNTDPFMQGLFPQLGLTPEKSNSQNNGCGFTMVPNADLGNGYLWTYPVNPYFSVTIIIKLL